MDRTYRSRIVISLALTLLLSAPGLARAVETPLAGWCWLEAAMSPEDLAGIVYEEFEGTLTIKNLTWTGSAAFYAYPPAEAERVRARCGASGPGATILCDGEDPVLTAAVRVTGIVLTQGTRDEAPGRPGILNLTYTFTDESGTAIGSATGVAPLEAIGDGWVRASLQGVFTLADGRVAFAGVGGLETYGLFGGGDEGDDDWLRARCDDGPYFVMGSESLVMTADKPGFAFEGARGAAALDRKFAAARQKLLRQKAQRLNVLEGLNRR